MKKYLNIIFALLVLTGLKANSAPLKADISSEHIPANTVIAVETIDSINSVTAKTYDRFDVKTLVDITAGSKMILPKGTIIRGSISSVVPTKMLSRDAAVFIQFDHLVSPMGAQVPVSIALHSTNKLTEDGGLGNGGNYCTESKQNVQNAGKIITTMTKWGIKTGEVAWNGWPKYVLTPISSIVSVPTSAIYLIGDQIVDIFKKGDNVILNKGERLNLIFLKGVDIRTY